RDLQALHQHITVQYETELGSLGHQVFKHLRFDTHTRTWNLNNASLRAAMNSHRQWGTDDSFAADDGDFDAVAVAGQDDERGQTLVEKIGELNFFAGLLQNPLMRQFHWLQMWAKKDELTFGNRVQYLIFHRLQICVGSGARIRAWISYFISNIRTLQTCSLLQATRKKLDSVEKTSARRLVVTHECVSSTTNRECLNSTISQGRTLAGDYFRLSEPL